MGRLRIKPKLELDETRLPKYVEVLREAFTNREGFDYYWNLDIGDHPGTEEEYLLAAADQLNITLTVRRLRASKRFHLVIDPLNKVQNFQADLITLLQTKGAPLRKMQILSALQMPQSLWYRVITPLINEGEIEIFGTTRSRVYQLPPEKPE